MSKLPNNATKAEIAFEHKRKMSRKKAQHAKPQQTRVTEQLAAGRKVGRNFSMTPKGKKRTRAPEYN